MYFQDRFVQSGDQNELMTDQGDLTPIQKIENQEIHQNSRKSWKFRIIKSEGGVHETLTTGQWAQ
jgi:hypothetical protein